MSESALPTGASTPFEQDSKPTSIAPITDVEKVEQDKTPGGDGAGDFVRPLTTWQWILVCIGLYLSAMLYGLDTTIAADVQGPILASLGDIEKLAWVGIGFPMGSVAVILFLGNLYGLFNIKYLVIASQLLFEIGSAICGAAPNMNAMIVGRVIAGMGGAGMYLGALTYVATFTSLKERSLYNALIGLCWGIGCILGPIVGGGFSESKATWRWSFYVNLPLAALVAPIMIFLFPSYNPDPSRTTATKLKSIDWLGAILNASTFTLFIIVLSFAGSSWSWKSGGVIALWVIFAVSLVSYALQATFSIFTTPERRLYPVQFLKSRTLVAMYIATASAATALAVSIYYIPIFFQFTRGDSAIKAAVRLLPFVALNVFATMFSGALLPVNGRYVPWYLAGAPLIIVGSVLMFRLTPDTHPAAIYGFEILIAIGGGLTQQLGYSVAAAAVQPHEVPAAIGFMNVAQIGSIAIALSIAGAIFQNVGFIHLRDALQGYNYSESDIRNALAGAQSVILSKGGEKVVSLAVAAIVETITKVYALVIAAGALMLVTAAFMRWEKMQFNPAAAGA